MDEGEKGELRWQRGFGGLVVYGGCVFVGVPRRRWHCVGELGPPRRSRDAAGRTASGLRVRNGFKVRVGKGGVL